MRLPLAHARLLRPRPPPAAADSRLTGRWLVGLRVGWVAIVLFDLAVFLASIPVAYAHLRGICPPVSVHGCSAAPTAGNLLALQRLHLSLNLYALSALVLALTEALLFMGVGAVIFWRKSAERLGLFISLWLIVFGASFIADSEIGAQVLAQTPQVVGLAFHYLEGAVWPGLILFLCTFPNGRFIPRWAWLWVIASLVIAVLPSDYPLGGPPPLLLAAQGLLLLGPAGFQLYRYLRISDARGRQQTKWFVFGVSIAFLSALISRGIGGVFPLDSPYQLLEKTLGVLIYFPIPLAIGVSILRYQLWDIDTLINKALVYGTLTALLAGVYAGLIIGLESLAGLVSDQASQPIVLVMSTLVIAALFLPLRRRIQRLIDRRFYRRKVDAEKTLAAFSAMLRDQVDLGQVRGQLLAVVDETMQPTQVSLWLLEPERRTEAPAYRLAPPGVRREDAGPAS